MGRTAKLTISLPGELIAMADKIAKARKISRSKVIAACLKDLEEKQRELEMKEGYLRIAAEQKQFTARSAGIAAEVLPEWK